MNSTTQQAPESYWTAVGNIVQTRPYGPGGLETRIGTKHFAPGAKVFIIALDGGMCENIVVIGLHRKSKRLIKIYMDVRWVENLRPMVCYSPAVIHKIKEHYPTGSSMWLTEEYAKKICEILPHWQANFRKPRSVANEAPSDNATAATPRTSLMSRLWASIGGLLRK